MKASIATTLCMLSLSMAICQAESTTIDLMTGSPTTKEVSTKPEITVEESGDTLTVSLNFHYARLTSQEGIEGSSIEIDGFSRNTVPGEAEWLLRNVNHPFEEGQFPSIELIGHEFIEMPMKLTLARNQSIDNAMNVSLQSMVNKYASNRYLPESPRCKVVISGYDLRPLIIDGAKGYSLWETLNKPKAEEDDEEDDGIGRWLFEAFNYTPPYKRYWSPIPGCLTYNEIKVADDARDLEFFGAFVYRSDLHPGCESYTLMPSFDGDSPTEMGCPWFGWQTYIVRKDLKVPNPRCQIIDGDYFELSDIDIIPNGIYQTDIHNDKHRIVSGTYEPIKPYSGWWPEMDEMIKPNETIAGYFDFCPFQYNYETRTVRFYTRLRLQFSEQSDVSSIYEDEDSPVFYTVDGRLEPNPQHGKIYLRKSSKGFDKILF